MNNTLIVLIPKVQNLETFGQFRPISLCSVLYKLIMKVISNRFKHIFPKIITQEQVGFIAGRSINENIILAQEVIHSMRSQKKRKWMAIKIDLEKAYDRVSWDFIDVSLRAIGIPEYLVNVIMSVISNPTMQGRILSNVERVRKGILEDPSCHICGFHSEDIVHILQYCSAAKDVWDQVNPAHKSTDYVHLFTDGAMQLDLGFAAAEVVIRDMKGLWITGFYRFLGKCSAFNAELWGILEGLKLLQRLGYDHVIIRSDSLEVVKGIHEAPLNASNSALIRRIHRIMSQENH
ncbi:hypothetical protein J1N35_013612 [Gossypium stocksii]|uniref:RNase H type-1 domain-containing protein n=1 Tax=Gossypium stocksii TaxID=47602 RepID=A0A9D3VVA5_9ROSI|nr:hypothetical protein J1N35_013612 [Gossypium stocksii]